MENFLSILLLAGGIIAILYLTEQGQNFLSQLPLPDPIKADIQTRINQRNRQRATLTKQRTNLTRDIQTLQRDSNNAQAVQAIITIIKNPKSLQNIGTPLTIQSIQALIQSQPQNLKHHTLLKQLTSKIGTKEAYNIALDTLSQNPEITQLKTLALEIGRIHYSSLRKNKRLTIYDEQALNNDIQSRAK